MHEEYENESIPDPYMDKTDIMNKHPSQVLSLNPGVSLEEEG